MGRVTIVDFSCAWVMKNIFQIERSKPGWMSREEVLKFYGELKADGIELMHDYWHDCSPEYLKEGSKDGGVPIPYFAVFTDPATTVSVRSRQVDETRKLLD